MVVKVALIQFNIVSGDLDHNLTTVTEQIEIAAQGHADLILLPELWNCGYDLLHLPHLAQGLQGPTVSTIRELAKKYKLFIFAGSIAEKKDGVYYNTTVAIDQKGSIVGKYRKIHLFSLGFEEDKFFSGGEDWGLVETPWGLAGMIICYDLRFPELMRNLALRGARFIVVPAQWPESKVDQWITFCKARALENQVYLFGTNCTGTDLEIPYPGKSLIVSPWGDVIKEGTSNQEVVLADIDMDEVDKAREALPALFERRSILDEIDNSQF
ncbi:carbon-nitrogen family hydrolase [Candidatus Formimonas warabiya]|uniref:carbon-nitrogen family hydrolase n=1 Tax=Formimonas warabiya TaxID=1761012 RepID=UPI001BE4A5AD|nr:carbon-nitrogen family hydrolase [Candidatus Formimonas warabiya]